MPVWVSMTADIETYLRSSHATGRTSMKSWSSSTQALLLRMDRGTWNKLRTLIFMYLRMGLGGASGGFRLRLLSASALDLAAAAAAAAAEA